MEEAYISYQRSRFRTRLPTDRIFTQGHFWLAPEDEASFRIGFTRFATRMLGEVVEYDFEIDPGTSMEKGQAIGWFEGFKAVTEMYSPLSGRFLGPNPDMAIGEIHQSPYDQGWLYRAEGPAPDDCMSPDEYVQFLDSTIDRMLRGRP